MLFKCLLTAGIFTSKRSAICDWFNQIVSQSSLTLISELQSGFLYNTIFSELFILTRIIIKQCKLYYYDINIQTILWLWKIFNKKSPLRTLDSPVGNLYN